MGAIKAPFFLMRIFWNWLRYWISGFVEKTMNFIKRTKEEVLNIEELLNSDSKILRELASVCVKYNEFLSENELCDGFECEIEKGRLNFNNVIVSMIEECLKINTIK